MASSRRTTTVQSGEELRGFRVKLYPTQEQLEYLGKAQAELCEMWNVLVTTWETHADYCLRHAQEAGVIGPVPNRPMLPKDSSAEASAQWAEYARLCRERRRQALTHCRTIHGLSRRDWANRAAEHHGIALTEQARKQAKIDYRVLRAAVPGGVTTAHMVQGMLVSYELGLRPGRPPPKLKKRARDMNLIVRSGGNAMEFAPVQTRTTPSGATRLACSHRCWVKFGSLKIKGRFHRSPPGSFLQGVAITLEHDGWYASANVRALPKAVPAPTQDVIAVNPGLVSLYADSEGHIIANPRANAYSVRVRELSDWLDDADTQWDAIYRRNQLGRFQERLARHVKDLIYSQVLPRLAPYRTILIGKTGKSAAHGVQTRISANDEGGYLSAMWLMQHAIVRRYGLYDPISNPTGRVRLVDSAGVSRRCSRCGTEHRSRFQRDNRRPQQSTDCPEATCRLQIDVDVNAARNLLAAFQSSSESNSNGCVEPAQPRPEPVYLPSARAARRSVAPSKS